MFIPLFYRVPPILGRWLVPCPALHSGLVACWAVVRAPRWVNNSRGTLRQSRQRHQGHRKRIIQLQHNRKSGLIKKNKSMINVSCGTMQIQIFGGILFLLHKKAHLYLYTIQNTSESKQCSNIHLHELHIFIDKVNTPFYNARNKTLQSIEVYL